MRRISKVRNNARDLTADEIVEIGDVVAIREYFGCTTPTAAQWLLRATRMVKRGSGAEYLERPPVVEYPSAMPERPSTTDLPPSRDLAYEQLVEFIAKQNARYSALNAQWARTVRDSHD